MVPESRIMAWFVNQNYRLLPYLPWKGLMVRSIRRTASAITLKPYDPGSPPSPPARPPGPRDQPL
ncbi:hypothetical protein GCM10022419_098220 [Nonomuraea rosea]|uniref:Uncharacterized protein n=1 Tax=Nonomuraea rosea TaxID=638574 RepID=A0ABP6Z6K1_9ACTN